MLLELWASSTAFLAFNVFKAARLREEIPKELEQIPATEAIELSIEEKEQHAPFYIGVGGPLLLGVPFGGGAESTNRTLFHNTWDGTKWIGGTNVDFKSHPTHQWWINTPDELQSYFTNKQIGSQSFAARLPLKVQEIRYVAGPLAPITHTLFHHRPTGLLASDASRIVERLVHKRTFGSFWGSVGAAVAAGTTVALLMTKSDQVLKV